MGWTLDELLAEHDVPGAQVAVLAGGEIRDEAAGVLNTRTRVEATSDAVFKIGSITKIWTATLVWQLVGEGVLDLDRPVRDHLPGFALSDPAAEATLTARHLLTHTGGVDANHFTDTGRDDDAIERFVATLADAGHPFRPGSVFSYSNGGFAVLGRLVEVLRGKPFHDVLRERLVAPLGLRTVATNADEAILHRAAIGHGEGGVPTAPWAVSYGTSPSGSHFAISARELLEFVRLHLTDPALAALRERWVDEVPDFGGGVTGWGLGWMQYPGGVVGHTGVSKGQKAFLRVVPSAGVAVAVLTNSTGGDPLAQEIFGATLKDLAGVDTAPLPVPPATRIPIDADRMCGTYRTAVYDITLSAEGDRAFLDHRPRREPFLPRRVEVVRLGADTIITAEPKFDGHQVFSLVGANEHRARPLPAQRRRRLPDRRAGPVRNDRPVSDLPVLCGLAVNPNSPQEVLLRLADHPQRGPFAPAAALPGRDHLPAAVAEVLAAHEETHVRLRLAHHRSTPVGVLTELAADPEPEVRAKVANWPDCWATLTMPSRQVPVVPLPEEVYRRLAADPDPSVRAGLGRNHYLPQSVRVLLAGDDDAEVRRCAALCALPAAVLRRLLGDADRAVREHAMMTLMVHAPEEMITLEEAERAPVYRSLAIKHVELTPPVLAQLLQDPDLHRSLAENPTLPVEQMRAFLHDAELCEGLAANPALPDVVLDELVATGNGKVHGVLANRRRDLPERLRRQLNPENEYFSCVVSLLPDSASLDERLSYLDHPNPVVRRTLALSSDLPADAVARLAAEPDFGTRLLLCERYQDVPPETLTGVLAESGGHTRWENLLVHPRLTAAAMAALIEADDEGFDRRAIATRPDLPPELALRLMDDDRKIVCDTAAANPGLPADRLRQALVDPSPATRTAVASNPSLGVAEIEELLVASW